MEPIRLFTPLPASAFIFTQIYVLFKNLRYLNFSSSSDHHRLTFGKSHTSRVTEKMNIKEEMMICDRR
jgi:hypothetical protein